MHTVGRHALFDGICVGSCILQLYSPGHAYLWYEK